MSNIKTNTLSDAKSQRTNEKTKKSVRQMIKMKNDRNTTLFDKKQSNGHFFKEWQQSYVFRRQEEKFLKNHKHDVATSLDHM